MSDEKKQLRPEISLKVKNPERWPVWSGSKVRQPLYIQVGGYTYEINMFKKPLKLKSSKKVS
jgi:hypothetical protein